MPTETLTLEQCKNLAGWGLPQELKRGVWYWQERPGKSIGTKGWKKYQVGDLCPGQFYGYYKIPDLEELMEFARVVLPLGWNMGPEKAFPGEFVVVWHSHSPWLYFRDKDPIQAVYKLIEKVKQ